MNRLNFSKEQYEAINHFSGPALVVAGPGSGKTSVITYRVNNLITHNHISPSNILIITFSKMAAVSMQTRISRISNAPVSIGTFHSIFFNILKNEYGFTANCIVKLYEKRKIISEILTYFDNSQGISNELIDAIIKRISYYKNTEMTIDNHELCSIDDELFRNISREYDERLDALGKIDFEDMMLRVKELLLKDCAILEKYQNKFRYILIDEFQDINSLQFDIVCMLAGEHKNIFAVGDDDQSIYGFRGAMPGIMKLFAQKYDAKIIKLECNYRSTKNIVRVASAIISENKDRFSKTIYTNNEINGEVILKFFENDVNYFDYIINELRVLESKKDQNTAILFRTNNKVNELAQLLSREKIAFNVCEKINTVYDTGVFRDFIHYLNMSRDVENISVEDFAAVMNKPVRYINRKNITTRRVDLLLLQAVYKDKQYVVKNIKKLEKDLQLMKNMDMYSAFHYFRHVINYDGYAINNYDDYKLYSDNANILSEELKSFSTYLELQKFVMTLEDNTKSEKMIIDKGGLYLMTYHASKGLEFDNVFLVGVQEGEVPSAKSDDNSSIEEERRMFYVAVTRAKKKLYLLTNKGNDKKSYLISRFLKPVIELEKSIKC